MFDMVRHASDFSREKAVLIAKELFGITANATPLPSERDQNFHLEASDGKAYVLKIANAKESRAVLEFQNQAMAHVSANKHKAFKSITPCPIVCTTPEGESIVEIQGENGLKHFVRLLTFLPGKPMAKVNPHDHTLLHSLGRFFGKINVLLKDFDHPGAHREFYWDVAGSSTIIEGLIHYIKDDRHIEDDKKASLVKTLLKRFQEKTEPLLDTLGKSVIHNDGNDYNVLAAPKGNFRNKVSGVIDFGDMVYSCTICDLAIVCAYAMLDKKDPLAAASTIIAGFHSAFALTEDEIRALFDLICMRLCISVCHSAHQALLQPDNAYLKISEQPAWGLLFRLVKISPDFARFCFREACGLSPVPVSDRLLSWLGKNRADFTPVTDIDLKTDPICVFDLGIASPMIPAGTDMTDPVVMTGILFSEMKTRGALAGIGKYNEARSIYTEKTFEVPGETRTEKRTIHLGVDIYRQTGSNVYALMEGKVHSFHDNNDHLDYGPTLILEHETSEGLVFYSLYGHLTRDSIAGLKPGTRIAKGLKIGSIGDIHENGGWPPHLHFQVMTHMLGASGNFPGVTQPSRRKIWTSICPDPTASLGLDGRYAASDEKNMDAILTTRRQNLGQSLSISYDTPLKIVRGMGIYLYDHTGQPYMDGVNNVCHVGHCHPHVVRAGQQQMAVLNTNTRYLHDHIVDYAQRLLATFPDPLNVCFFVCSGSEANELALRMARTFTGQKDLVTVDGAYHGNTQGLIDISPYKHDGPGGSGAPQWVQTVQMPCGYRGPHKGSSQETGIAYAGYVKEAINAIKSQGRGVAAYICESMLGCGGQVVLPDGYLKAAFGHVRDAGGMCIVDEIQVGFGRVGSHFWAFETQDVVPDIVTLGKPIGNGHPLAAVVTTKRIANAFNNGMEYFNTFGGNPVSCAVGMAVLDVIENENLQQNAHDVGKYLLEKLKPLEKKYSLVGNVRGLGLYIGIELVKDRTTLEPAAEHAAYISNRMKDYGILMSTDGPLHNVLKLKPPIVFSKDNADELVQALDRILSEDGVQL